MIKLPSEVYQNIFNYLEGKELFECLLVCKTWHPYANQLYWKNVVIHSSRLDDINSLLCEDGCEKYFKYGHLTREMGLQLSDPDTFSFYDSGFEYKILSENDISHLMTYFPNIQKITVEYEYYQDYLRLLLNTELKKIKKIETNQGIDCYDYDTHDLYMEFCLKHKDTMTSLNFNYTRHSGIIDNQLVDLFTLSSTFKNVTELSFYNDFRRHLTFMQVQVIFPNLVAFYYESEFSPDNDIVQEKIDTIGDSSIIHFNRNLKVLAIFSSLTVSSVKYLIKYLPNQLEKINLNIKYTCLHVWINAVGEENVLKLMERLNGVKSVNIWFFDEREYYDMVPTNTQISSYFKIANALIRNKKIYFSFRMVEDYNSNNRLTYNASKGLELKYAYNIKTDFSETNNNTIEFSLPDKTTPTIGSEIISHLEFTYNSSIIKHTDAPRAVIEYIFTNYPKLDRFILKNSSNDSYEVRVDNLKETERLTTRTSTRENLKALKLIDVAKHQKMIKTLATYLPWIEYIRCEFNNYDSSYDDMHFNLNVFENLTRFYFYVGVADRMDSHYLNIDIYYENHQDKRYCYDARAKKMITEEEFECIENNAKTETVTFKLNQRTRIGLYHRNLGIVAVFSNEGILNLETN